MLGQTDHPAARWQMVAAASKHYTRVWARELVIAAVDEGLRASGENRSESRSSYSAEATRIG